MKKTTTVEKPFFTGRIRILEFISLSMIILFVCLLTAIMHKCCYIIALSTGIVVSYFMSYKFVHNIYFYTDRIVVIYPTRHLIKKNKTIDYNKISKIIYKLGARGGHQIWIYYQYNNKINRIIVPTYPDEAIRILSQLRNLDLEVKIGSVVKQEFLDKLNKEVEGKPIRTETWTY